MESEGQGSVDEGSCRARERRLNCFRATFDRSELLVRANGVLSVVIASIAVESSQAGPFELAFERDPPLLLHHPATGRAGAFEGIAQGVVQSHQNPAACRSGAQELQPSRKSGER